MGRSTDTTSLLGSRLAEKYGSAPFDDPPAITRSRLEEKFGKRDEVDQHFAAATLRLAHGMHKRRVLDEHTRFLVLLGQFTVTKSLGHLEDALRAAFGAGLPARLALEPILHCAIYGGDSAVEPALQVFVRVARELGVLSELKGDQLPIDGHDRTRDLEAERKMWPPDVERDSRREDLMRRYGQLGISTGLRYRGRHQLDVLEYFDALDPEFAGLWLGFAYQAMYSRWIMDDKTRLLCTAGDCIAIGDAVQAREHMKGAMAAGVTPREVMEVIFLSGVYFGFPGMVRSLKAFVALVGDLGRLAEIGNPPAPVQ